MSIMRGISYTKVSARNLYSPETCTVTLLRTQASLNGSLCAKYFRLLNVSASSTVLSRMNLSNLLRKLRTKPYGCATTSCGAVRRAARSGLPRPMLLCTPPIGASGADHTRTSTEHHRISPRGANTRQQRGQTPFLLALLAFTASVNSATARLHATSDASANVTVMCFKMCNCHPQFKFELGKSARNTTSGGTIGINTYLYACAHQACDISVQHRTNPHLSPPQPCQNQMLWYN